MTTTPAPLDLDALKALEQAAAHAPWIVQDANEDYPHEYGAYWVLTKPDAESDDTIMELRSGFRADAELVAAMRNALPALLDELANERWLRENAGKVCDNAVAATHEIAKQRDAALDELATERCQGAAMASITGEAIRQIAEERDAARKELAKTRAELDLALPFLRDGALAEHHSKCGEASQWDIRRCEDAHCLERAHLLEDHGLIPQEWDTYPIPEANPATTAEPADEPKATSQRQCDVLLPPGWCRLVMDHKADHTAKRFPTPIGECFVCANAPLYPLDTKSQRHVAMHKAKPTHAEPAAG